MEVLGGAFTFGLNQDFESKDKQTEIHRSSRGERTTILNCVVTWERKCILDFTSHFVCENMHYVNALCNA
mgnify:FL=1